MLCAVLLLTALGFSNSWNQCQLTPSQQGMVLGLQVGMVPYQYFVGQDKVYYIKLLLSAALETSRVTKRQLASIAGVFM